LATQDFDIKDSATRSSARYQLEEQLGAGTVGTVYRARNVDTGQRVALKVLLPSACKNDQIRARFLREMYVLERLSHPNIVRCYGGGQMDHQLFFAMDIIDGGSIRQVIDAHGKIPWPQAVRWSIRVLSALQHAHNHGVIHRDIKPSNLFLTTDGRIVLGDFGIAFDVEGSDITLDGLTVGTVASPAPEQTRGEREITGKSDIYSYGCVLFEMLTGRLPYRGRSYAQIIDGHLNQPVPNVNEAGAHCPGWLDEIVYQMMQKDPAARPFNARSVEGYLMDHLDRAEAGQQPNGQQAEEFRPYEQWSSSPYDLGRISAGRMLALAAMVLVLAMLTIAAALQH